MGQLGILCNGHWTNNPSKGTSNSHSPFMQQKVAFNTELSYLILPTIWAEIHLNYSKHFNTSCLLSKFSILSTSFPLPFKKDALKWPLPEHNQEPSPAQMVNMISQGKRRWTWSSQVTSPSCSSSALLQYVVRWLMKKVTLSWQGKGWQNAMYSGNGKYTWLYC